MAEALLFDRVAARARRISVAKALLTLLALPFYVLGALVGLVFVAVGWAWAAGVVGATEARARWGRRGAPGGS